MAWCIGILSAVYGFSSLEIAKRLNTPQERSQAPVMSYNVLANGLLVFPFIIAFLFCIGDLDGVLSSPIAKMPPPTRVYRYVSPQPVPFPGVSSNALSTFIAFLFGVGAIGSGTRALFAMARDKFPSRSPLLILALTSL
ncbi:hypothetical protein F4779DRAFT_621208 [Xylariaceae sp. FL0662B]|nr:hypothetical protein F4779DRAFT_621208 [Xylariaceae sp. FL0662B]